MFTQKRTHSRCQPAQLSHDIITHLFYRRDVCRFMLFLLIFFGTQILNRRLFMNPKYHHLFSSKFQGEVNLCVRLKYWLKYDSTKKIKRKTLRWYFIQKVEVYGDEGGKSEIQFQLNLMKLIYMILVFVAILCCGHISSSPTSVSQK